MKLGEIASSLSCELEGDAGTEISGVSGIEQAQAGQLTFISNPRYRHALRTTSASAVLVAGDIRIEREPGQPRIAALRSGNPYLDFARAIELFYKPPLYTPDIHPTVVIASTARIGSGAHIGPYCFIDEGVQIGKDAVLHSFVTIYRDARIGNSFFAHAHAVVREACHIGNRVILQNGVIIGGDGFGFARRADGHWHKILQAGITVLEDDVEVQSNACVDRATLGETLIQRGVKIDDLALVGHGSTVGEDSVLCGQVGLAGTTVIGKACTLAGQAGIAGHLKIGDRAIVTAQSGVPTDVPAGKCYSGYPAVENRQWLKNTAAASRMPEVLQTVRKLEAEIAVLKERVARIPQ